MSNSAGVVLLRILPVLLLTIAGILYVAYIEGPDAYAVRNALPMLLACALSAIAVIKGGGRWAGNGWRWPLGTIGFAIPAIGLSLYLHYGYSVDLDGMYSGSVYPQELFRFLPIYTVFAGVIGFAIGWIVGRNI